MGQMILDDVITLLSNGGIRAEAAWPAEHITRITSQVAAVSLEEVDREGHSATVLVEILGPKDGGGYACQQKALAACAILETAGAVCTQGRCQFVSNSNVFRVPVKAVFRGTVDAYGTAPLPVYSVYTGTLQLPYVCGFSAEQVLSKGGTLLANEGWKFTVEEFFPWGVCDSLEEPTPFTLKLNSNSGIEEYTSGYWTRRKRIVEESGIRQIREGMASKRFISS